MKRNYKIPVIIMTCIIIASAYYVVNNKSIFTNTVNPVADNNPDKNTSPVDEAEPSTLQGLKEKYGRIDVITLFTGRVIQGIIKSRGEAYTILTPGGIMKVKVGNIMKTNVKH